MIETGEHTHTTGERLSFLGTEAWQNEQGLTLLIAQILARSQGGALARRQETRSIDVPPAQPEADSSSSDISETMRAFEASLADVLAATADMVKSRIVTYVKEEVPRVLEEALGGREEIAGQTAAAADGGVSGPSAQSGDHDRENGVAVSHTWGFGGGRWVGAPPPARVSSNIEDPAEIHEAADQEDHGYRRWGAIGIAEMPVAGSADGVYEGNVRLRVDGHANIYEVIRFLQALRGEVRLRMHGMVSNARQDVELLLGLREPLYLEEILAEMTEVSEVTVDSVPNVEGADPLPRIHRGRAFG